MNHEPNRDDSLPEETHADALTNGELKDERSLLTAYALGELAEGDRAAVEARLKESAEERQASEATTRLGKLLRKVADESPLPRRSAGLREAVLARLAEPVEAEAPLRVPRRFPVRRFWLPLSLAASLAVVCGTIFALTKTKRTERVVAQSDFITASQPPADDGQAAGLSTHVILDDMTDARASAGRDIVEETETVSRVGKYQANYDERDGGYVGDKSKSDLQQAQQLASEGEPRSAMDPSYFATSQPPSSPGHEVGGKESIADPKKDIKRGDFLNPIKPIYTKPGGGQRSTPPAAPSEALSKAKGADVQDRIMSGMMQSASRRQQASFELPPAGPFVPAGRRLPRHEFAPPTSEFEIPPARLRIVEGQPGNESYSAIVENSFRKSTEHPLSTFSIDVDTASYANVRRFLNSHAMPPRDAVRIEELINYFQYNYPQPEGETPFSITTDVAKCPWNAEHRLLRVGLKGRDVPADHRPASNLVFLIDVSGSMGAANKLPLVKEALYLLTDKLTENDRVAIVVYAGNAGLTLPPTNGENKAAIREAISQLIASGSTNGGQGLQMAYDAAQSHFIQGGTNRVILATDGDFNVGVVDQNDLVRLIEEKAKGGVYLSALGFGVGNLKDATLEKLADKGNGNYAYIDTIAEARRALVEQLSGTLVTIAKDVKLQIEFNPARAAEHRLIGYEDRVMPHQDFHDDRKDAGEIGAGHSVTALYEIVPAGAVGASGERLKYQRSQQVVPAAESDELATIKLRYKQPDGDESRLIEHIVADQQPKDAGARRDFDFAAAVAAFGMLLRDSPHRGEASYMQTLVWAHEGLGDNSNGRRAEFVRLVRQAKEISGKD